MAYFNQVIVLGNLTRDPELTTTTNNNQVCNFSIASNRHYKTDAGEQQETLFVEVEAWGKSGELVSKYLRKGSACLIEGRLKLDQWQDEETQAKRSRHKVVLENVQFLSPPKDSANGGGASSVEEGEAGASGQRPPRKAKPLPTERLASNGGKGKPIPF